MQTITIRKDNGEEMTFESSEYLLVMTENDVAMWHINSIMVDRVNIIGLAAKTLERLSWYALDLGAPFWFFHIALSMSSMLFAFIQVVGEKYETIPMSMSQVELDRLVADAGRFSDQFVKEAEDNEFGTQPKNTLPI